MKKVGWLNLGEKMQFDIVFVTFNSEKWVNSCFSSIINNNYDLKKLSIIVVDNNSYDKTKEQLSYIKNKYNHLFNSFKIIKSQKNLGFGKGCNLGAGKGSSPFIFFLNIDTELPKNTFNELQKAIQDSEEIVALWELRQFPFEHPKYYNPVTGYTSWSSGSAFIIRRNIFERINGFDETIFMYAEDVDLSWRIRILGYKLRYIPKVVVHHYSYEKANQIKPQQYINSIVNNLLLRYKFGSIKDILKGYLLFFTLLTHKGPFKHSRKLLIKTLIKQHFMRPFIYLKWRLINFKYLKYFNSKFLDWDYEIIRAGAFYKNFILENQPLVSVIVRTCNRPNVLRQTLQSLRNQTYQNFEVIVVEDGKNEAQGLIESEFNDLNITYHATGINQGRCIVGNIGLQLAKGKYVNFLDDDDVVFADHIEVLVGNLEKNNKYRIAYTLAFETPIVIKSQNPYIIEEVFHYLIYQQPFSRILLFHHNYLPLQSVMFKREIFLEEGGFDESLDVLEDWDLWVRYALKNNFFYIEKVTSMYRVPFNKKEKIKRQDRFDKAIHLLRNKHTQYVSFITVAETARELEEILNSYIVKISRENFPFLQNKRPFLTKLLLKLKKYFI